jgi:hypothetical protein
MVLKEKILVYERCCRIDLLQFSVSCSRQQRYRVY